MKLTALEIKQQTFDKSIRGYDITEVQAFLNLISNEWEHLVTRNRELEQQIGKLNERLKHYERVESALHETLQTAKDSAEKKMESVKKDSRNIIEKAEIEADGILREANQQRQQIRQSILNLLDRRNDIIGGIRSYLDNARESVQHFTKDEAKLFNIPPEDQQKTESKVKKKDSEKSKEDTNNKNRDQESPSLPPGSEDMDDILDEID